MADMLADGAAMVADSISSNVSQTVTYRRGRTDITNVKAARGAPVREVDTQLGVLQIVGVPWFIKPSLLVSGAETWEPQKNDMIVEADQSEWLVVSDNSEQEHLLGSFGKLWRVETKRHKAPA